MISKTIFIIFAFLLIENCASKPQPVVGKNPKALTAGIMAQLANNMEKAK